MNPSLIRNQDLVRMKESEWFEPLREKVAPLIPSTNPPQFSFSSPPAGLPLPDISSSHTGNQSMEYVTGGLGGVTE